MPGSSRGPAAAPGAAASRCPRACSSSRLPADRRGAVVARLLEPRERLAAVGSLAVLLDPVAVVAQEQLLQGGRLAGEAADARVGEAPQEGLELGGVDLAAQLGAVGTQVV